ncbi:peptidase [Pseudoalteromonas sp. JBTF-M23]|uniref:Peptidase n=1 Tax=Pseudoalteromonas caenipelagi TaxID=2726988 RepID=A0A849VHG3_9GAMM|nr:M4 family metallopeptidase [Pseudoalteromonas caenipelagi]NOU51903.1 peptidase [Pseudoalteromonas caenipelagi]
MNKLSVFFAIGVFGITSDAQAIQSHSLLNQAHVWQVLEQSIAQQQLDNTEQSNIHNMTDGYRDVFTYRLIKRAGKQKEYRHYQTYLGQWPVLGARFVLINNGDGQVKQGLGKTVLAKETLGYSTPKRFLQSDEQLLADIAKQLNIIVQDAELTRAYEVSNEQLNPVIVLKGRVDKQLYRYVIDARTLQVISRKQDLDALNDNLVAGGGIGGNEKLGAICYSPQPQSMNNCLNYRFDASDPTGQELLFQVQDGAIFQAFSGYPFIVTKLNDTCTLENPYVKTIDYMGDKSVAASYQCGSTNEHFDKQRIDDQYYDYYSYLAVNEAHFNAGVVMQYYHTLLKQMYPQQSTDCEPNGFCLKQLKQNVGNNTYGNTQANWDDSHVNYGTGNYGGTHYFHTTLDVVAHEASHAVTFWNSQLGAADQDGAINEAFSDIASVAVLDYLQANVSGAYSQSAAYLQQISDSAQNHQKNRKWWYGWDVMYEDKGARFFEMPSWDGRSIDHFKDYQTGLSTYHTGGVLRKAFYELVKTHHWSIEDAFKLFLRANIECFFPDASIADAGQCILSQAGNFTYLGSETELKADIDETLHSVGIVARSSDISTLDFTSSINYDTVNYRVTSVPVHDIARLDVDWGDGTEETWQEGDSSNIYDYLERSRQVNVDDLVRFKLMVTLKDGQQKVGYRHFYSRAVGASCEPYFNQGQVHTTDVSVNGAALTLSSTRYQSLLASAVSFNRHNEHTLTLPSSLSDKRLTLLVDSNRNGLFSADEMILNNQLIGSGVVNFTLPETLFAGTTMLRMAIGSEYNFYDTCGHTKLAQVVDLKADIDVPELPIKAGFDYQILADNRVEFTNTSQANVLRQPKYQWQFGFDGRTSSAQNPGIIDYPKVAGNYTITLSVSYQDGSGESDTFSKDISLSAPQQCVVGISDSNNASAFYIDQIMMWTSINDRLSVTGAQGTNSSGYVLHKPNFSFTRSQELTVDIVSNEISEFTAERLLNNRENELRFTVWLDKDGDKKFEFGEENFSDINSNYLKECSNGRCRIKASQSLFLPYVRWWEEKDYVIRARLEEQPQASKGQDGCNNFHYGEVSDIKFSVTGW